MAKDFQAKQIRGATLITSGGFANGSLVQIPADHFGTGEPAVDQTVAMQEERLSKLGLLVYSSSQATNFAGGIVDPGTSSTLGLSTMLANVGKDVSIFISGSGTLDGDDYKKRKDVMLYGGDLVVSGTLWAERMIVEVHTDEAGDLLLSGALHIEPDTNDQYQLWVTDQGGYTLLMVDAIDKSVGINTSIPHHGGHAQSGGLAALDIGDGSDFFGGGPGAHIALHPKDDVAGSGSIQFYDRIGGVSGTSPRASIIYTSPLNVGGTGKNYLNQPIGGNLILVNSGGVGREILVVAKGGYEASAALTGSIFSPGYRGTTYDATVTGDAQWLFLSGVDADPSILGSCQSPDPRSYGDTNFWVSGTIDSKDLRYDGGLWPSQVRGVGVFGGDLLASGTVYVGGLSTTPYGSTLEITASMVDIGWNPNDTTHAVGPTLRLSSHDSTVEETTPTVLGSIEFWGNDRSFSSDRSGVGTKIIGEAAGTWSSGQGDYPSELQFWTTRDGGMNYITQRMVISQGGQVGIGITEPSILAKLSINDGTTPVGDVGAGAHIRMNSHVDRSGSIQFVEPLGTFKQNPRASLVYEGTNTSGNGTIALVSSGSAEATLGSKHILLKGLVPHSSGQYIYVDGVAIEWRDNWGGAPDGLPAGSQVRILSGNIVTPAGGVFGGEPAKSPDPRTFVDTSFWVSGTIGSMDRGFEPGAPVLVNAVRGTSVFGGDLFVSGAIRANNGLTVRSLGATAISVSGTMLDIGWDPDNTSAAVPPRLRLSTHQADITTGEDLGRIEFWGGDTDGFAGVGAGIRGVSIGTWDATARPTELQFYASTDGGSGELLKIFSLGYEGSSAGEGRATLNIGTDKAQGHLHVNAESSAAPPFGGATIILSHDDGTIAKGERLGSIGFYGTENSGTDWGEGAAIQAFTEESWTEGSNEGANLRFSTQPLAGTPGAPVERMRISADGKVGIGTGVPFSELHLYDTASDGATILVSSHALSSGSIGFSVESGDTQAALVYEASNENIVLVHSGTGGFREVIVKGAGSSSGAGKNWVTGSAFVPSTDATLVDDAGPQWLFLSGVNKEGGLWNAPGNSATSPDPKTYRDANFWVSGTIGSKDLRQVGGDWAEQVRGTAVFGGDLVVSGTAYGADGLPLAAGGWTDDGTVVRLTTSTDRVGIGTSSPNMNMHLKGFPPEGTHLNIDLDYSTPSGSGSIAFTKNSGPTQAALVYEGSTDALTLVNSGTAKNIIIKGHNPATLSEIGVVTGSLFIPATSTTFTSDKGAQWLFLSGNRADHTDGGSESSPDPQSFSDTNFWVSGTIGSKDDRTDGGSWTEQVRGTSVFGGDVVISGSLFGGSALSLGHGAELSGSIYLQAQSAAANSQAGDREISIYARGAPIKLYQNVGGVESTLGAIMISSGSTEYDGITQLSLGNLAVVEDEGSGVLSLTGSIGEPYDGVWGDGLFTSFNAKTPIGTAIDKFNEVLASLAPSPAPDVSGEAGGYGSSAGTDVYVSWDSGHTVTPASNPIDSATDIGGNSTAIDVAFKGAYNVLTGSTTHAQGNINRLGAYGDGVGGMMTMYGNVNAEVVQDDEGAYINYVATSFGDADQGTLSLYVNGAAIVFTTPAAVSAIDLTLGSTGAGVPGAGSEDWTKGGGGTGIIELSAVKSATSSTGGSLAIFKHRTARIRITATDQLDGWNHAYIKHTIGSVEKGNQLYRVGK